ncbi:MAG TPA: SWIM zinc finger family protein [Gemmataceae bacterium]|nr:SWIM zinc finger family protein [Gemmataceae bacterium]
MWYRDFYPRSRPRKAKGGIKSQSKRGAFGQSWWAKRWIAVLESFDIGARLGRGRSYARNGQVLAIDVNKGKVTAKVQGSSSQPYKVAIAVQELSAKQWDQLVRALSGQALFVAKLLAGEMPQDIEQVFTDAKLSLFPEKSGDLTTECSCPDWSNPCKHVAAVYYLLGEEFDRDPFLLFQLRGLGREELLKRLSRGAPASAPPSESAAADTGEEASIAPAEPIPTDPAIFWGVGGMPQDRFGEVRQPPVPAAWLQRLGAFPFWRGEADLLDSLEPIYAAASARGLEVFLGEQGGANPSTVTKTDRNRASALATSRS